MQHDEIDIKAPIVDLYYPDENSRNKMKKRRADLMELPQDYISNLELERVSGIICNHYQFNTLKMFEEMCDDVNIITYRQDILEDFLNIPKLAATVQKIINIMVENDRTNVYNFSSPDSFRMLDEAITAFQAYVDCMEIMHDFYKQNKPLIKSAGIIKLFEYFEDGYDDKNFRSLKGDLDELKTAVQNRIRSVTVAINLNENLVPVGAGIVDYSDQ